MDPESVPGTLGMGYEYVLETEGQITYCQVENLEEYHVNTQRLNWEPCEGATSIKYLSWELSNIITMSEEILILTPSRWLPSPQHIHLLLDLVTYTQSNSQRTKNVENL